MQNVGNQVTIKGKYYSTNQIGGGSHPENGKIFTTVEGKKGRWNLTLSCETAGYHYAKKGTWTPGGLPEIKEAPTLRGGKVVQDEASKKKGNSF